MITIDQAPLTHEIFASCTEKVALAAAKMQNDIQNAANEQGEEVSPEQSQNQPKRPKITKNLLEGKISPSPTASEILCAVAFLAFKKSRCNRRFLPRVLQTLKFQWLQNFIIQCSYENFMN